LNVEVFFVRFLRAKLIYRLLRISIFSSPVLVHRVRPRLPGRRRRWILKRGIHGEQCTKQVPGLRGYFHSGCAQSWASKVLSEARLPGGWQGRCDVQALALYLVLVTVADAQGLSYYGEASLTRLLSMPAARLVQARADLIRLDLIAYERPLYQVLSLDPPAAARVHGMRVVERGLAQLRATLAVPADRDRRG